MTKWWIGPHVNIIKIPDAHKYAKNEPNSHSTRWWVGCRSACKRFKWWSWTDMMDGKQYQYQCPRNYKRNFIALELQDRWWSDQQILGTLHVCRRHQDAGRDESQPAIAGYEKFCEMATLPTCILRWALFYFCIHPPFFCLLLQSSFLPPKYTFEVLFPLWKMWACNTLLWLSGRRVVIVVVVIVPFSIHFRASFWGAAGILHVCAFSYVSELFFGKGGKK